MDGKYNKLTEVKEGKFFAYGSFEIIAPSDFAKLKLK
jgi:hypothetical protein